MCINLLLKNAPSLSDKKDQLSVPLLFAKVVGERSKFWEMLGNWDILRNSYRLIPKEMATVQKLVPDALILQLPGWITLNNATSLPRILQTPQHGDEALIRFDQKLTDLLEMKVVDFPYGKIL